MKTVVLVLGFLLSANALAESVAFDLQGFNFTYQNPKGSGTAESFSRNQKKAAEQVSLEVEKIAEAFQVNVAGSETHQFLFKDAPSFVMEAQTMTIEGMNFTFTDHLSLAMDSAEFISENDELGLDRFNLDCARHSSQADLMDQVISGCVENLKLTSSKFNSGSKKAALMNVLKTISRDKGDLGIKNLELTSKSGKYELAADVKAQVSGRAKSNGYLAYDPTTGILTIKISEVKFGLLNVKKMVFDELKKQQSETLQVKEPYVYFHLKN